MNVFFGSALILLLCSGLVSGNTYCEQSYPGDSVITRVEGKMNVPIKPKVEPHHTLFLWPGANPNGDQGGMMQPVLVYGQNDGQGQGVWGISNWFTNCDNPQKNNYCSNDAKPVKEGDTISWYMQFQKNFSNGTQHWEMGYYSYNDHSLRDTLQVYRSKKVQMLWATEAEYYLSQPWNQDKIPRSNFYTWGIKVKTADGKEVPLAFTPSEGQGKLDCDFSVTSNGVTFTGTKLMHPPFNDGCVTAGYSRTWMYGCQTWCGCNNHDGTPKIACDYCCNATKGVCHRETGPTSVRVAGAPADEPDADGVHPGKTHEKKNLKNEL